MSRIFRGLTARSAAAAFLVLLVGNLALPATARSDSGQQQSAPSGPTHKHKHERKAAAKHHSKKAAAGKSRQSPGSSAAPAHRETGQATWYGDQRMEGRRTASGERFDSDQLTAAHPSLPMNTRVRVKNLQNGKSVTVRINDRNKRVGKRMIDLSKHAAEELGMKHRGVAPVTIETVTPGRKPG